MAFRQIEISKEALEALKPGPVAYEVMDTKLDGFGVRVNPTGKIAFILRWSLRSRDGRGTLGSFPKMTVMAAKKKAAVWIGMVAKGEDPRAEKKRLRAAQTVKEFMTDWLGTYVSQLAAKTIKDYTRIVKKVILPRLGTRMVADLTEKDALEMHQALADHPRSANMALAVFSSAMSTAEAWDQRPPHSNPCMDVERYEEDERTRSLSLEEMQAFCAWLDKNEEKHALPIAQLRLLLMTGARLGEAKKLEWEWVDLEGGAIRIPRTKHKTGKKTKQIRLVGLGPHAVVLLQARAGRKLSKWVFPGKKGPYMGLESWWQRRRETDLKTMGLSDFHIHDLRHTFATWARMNGMELDDVGDLLGHTNSNQTRRYAHITVVKARKDASAVEGALVGSGG